MQFTGPFETHITVSVKDLEEIEKLRQWSAHQGLKCLHILLDRGFTPSQPMLTRWGEGRLSDELDRVQELCQVLQVEGFTIVRIKTEVAADHPSVPQGTTDILNYTKYQYFEHHIKVLLPPLTSLNPLIERVEPYCAHLSRNALKMRQDSYQERFVTQRCRGVGRQEAEEQLKHLLQAIADLNIPILDIEQEFVVYDSNFELDRDWIH
ncbi:hypothetical protein PMG71_21730 [Roseofilum sp. BLCC_M154]|uniref:Uncharacterized protein n=1 Tax=Roseofilum acuticapitatum BLCC-M154 TaxID=3022444 RepID=A0ABT7B0K3_9CYAN|nr:hypothetical protein [Roseofilum acuticapitatum]MDJ1172056.1 hypothetical protein [Roseofilum acuticapitatum BLCC-M154]